MVSSNMVEEFPLFVITAAALSIFNKPQPNR